MDDEPIAAGLVFDTSGSMGNKLSRSRMAAAQFFRISDVEDEFFLVEFDSKPRLVVPPDQGHWPFRGGVNVFRAPKAPRPCWTRSTWRSRKCASRRRTNGASSSSLTAATTTAATPVKEVRDLIQESDVLIYADRRIRRCWNAGGSGRSRTAGAYCRIDRRPDVLRRACRFARRRQEDRHRLRNRYILGYSPENQVRRRQVPTMWK